MFREIYVEKSCIDNVFTQRILKYYDHLPHYEIDQISDYFGKYKKPYLHKRKDLNIYIGNKKGELVKSTPDAYGTLNDYHFYFLHSFNCIYECQYCYLQGYFNSPDLVFFVNHEEIILEIQKTIKNVKLQTDQSIWFHAGEFSDSLALSHITNEWPLYFDFFKKQESNVYLELRSKSDNIDNFLNLEPNPQVIYSFSLSSRETINQVDLKTPSLEKRLVAIKKLMDNNHFVALHFDPIIYNATFHQDYDKLFEYLNSHINLRNIRYFSIGVVRFSDNVFKEVKRNYPESKIWAGYFSKSKDGKVKYSKELRDFIFDYMEQKLKSFQVDPNAIYRCMEN